MGLSLDQVVEQAREGDRVAVSLTTNEDDGIATYADGELVFHPATISANAGGFFRRTRLASEDGRALKMYFSDRRLAIDPPPPPGSLPSTPRQPFSADATEALGASLSLGFGDPVLTVNLFGNSVRFPMTRSGTVLVGTGPQFGKSPSAVWVLAFIGVIRAPG